MLRAARSCLPLGPVDLEDCAFRRQPRFLYQRPICMPFVSVLGACFSKYRILMKSRKVRALSRSYLEPAGRAIDRYPLTQGTCTSMVLAARSTGRVLRSTEATEQTARSMGKPMKRINLIGLAVAMVF